MKAIDRGISSLSLSCSTSSVSVPFEIVHGWHDDVVPVENSIRFAQSEHANLHILNGNHGLTENLDDINKYSIDDFKLEGYEHHPPIKAKMAI